MASGSTLTNRHGPQPPAVGRSGSKTNATGEPRSTCIQIFWYILICLDECSTSEQGRGRVAVSAVRPTGGLPRPNGYPPCPRAGLRSTCLIGETHSQEWDICCSPTTSFRVLDCWNSVSVGAYEALAVRGQEPSMKDPEMRVLTDVSVFQAVPSANRKTRDDGKGGRGGTRS
jgi:hypothetical protein